MNKKIIKISLSMFILAGLLFAIKKHMDSPPMTPPSGFHDARAADAQQLPACLLVSFGGGLQTDSDEYFGYAFFKLDNTCTDPFLAQTPPGPIWIGPTGKPASAAFYTPDKVKGVDCAPLDLEDYKGCGQSKLAPGQYLIFSVPPRTFSGMTIVHNGMNIPLYFSNEGGFFR